LNKLAWTTEYIDKIDSKKYQEKIYADTEVQATIKLKSRKLNENFADALPKLEEIESLPSEYIKSKNYIKALHATCQHLNIIKTSSELKKAVSDAGVIHDLIHLVEGIYDDETEFAVAKSLEKEVDRLHHLARM
jgi:hypothetical protein